jgi:hypothetical protein
MSWPLGGWFGPARIGVGPVRPGGRFSGPGPACTLASGQLGAEGVEALFPEPAEPVQPRVDLAQRRGVDCVEPPGALGPYGREPAVAQHAQMLGDGGLGDPELGPYDVRDRPGGPFTVGQQFQNASAHRVAKDVEGVHGGDCIALRLYKSTLFLGAASGSGEEPY